MSLLTVNHVSKTFDQTVLNDISLTVEKGDVLALLGKSGSGKSTLLNIIAGLLTQDSGEVICTVPKAYMQQKDLLLPFKTVLDNVALPELLHQNNKEDVYYRAVSLLEKTDLLPFTDSYPNVLSGGMKQRVSFARTILANRELLLLDEPFGALDAMTRLQLQDWYLELVKQYELTTILVTHDIDEALLLANKIVILKNGTLSQLINVPTDKKNYRQSPKFLEQKYAILKQLMID